MRLLHTRSLQVEEFVPGNIPGKYAILSHTWEEGEVTLEDMEKGIARSKMGYRKLARSCELANRNDYEWIWIDTCCIDKRNSAELSEAINSMFEYYSQSTMCYVYLSNVESLDGFEKATWFTRGWTLQELLAPRNVIFFNSDWQKLGTKKTLSRNISSRTRIPEAVVQGKSIHSCTVGRRMSWAAERETTREEDIAYCLLGLFGIHMVPIYGEGAEQAFLRLQTEILQRSADHTLFIWTQKHDPQNLGLLATSPRSFCCHTECFAWMRLEHRAEQRTFDAYAYLKRKSNKTSMQTFSIDNETGRSGYISVESPEYPVAATLGQSGLHVSLLSHIPDQSVISNKLSVRHKIILFDLLANKTPVYLELSRDLDSEKFHSIAPDRLGTWRRGFWSADQATYSLGPIPLSFNREPITISQLKTPTIYPRPVTFEFTGSTSEALVSQVLLVEPTGKKIICSAPPKIFACQGGVVVLQHSCSQCGPNLKVVLNFGGHGRVVCQPWCYIGSIDMSNENNSLPDTLFNKYESNLRHSGRYGSMSIGSLPCKTQLSGQIGFGTRQDFYSITLSSVRSRGFVR